ncbi:MAG: TonB-dependent receptor [Bacteroidetes bacterium]|nr:TonB-dependent receptor [Bacteroidota bacterium]MBT6685188.1 TonB-dependent receptor [Bacteroidota bacterium]MBT7143445.1 TonB-dependent receptor [Bacteroidota bacterium]MBT7492041.1 TonB-dependent receptor [Bacteroidota bacterium]
MIKSKFIYLIFACLSSFPLLAQQTVRGVIIDLDSKVAIPFATIQLLDSSHAIGTVCDESGKFRIENVPIGRQSFAVSCMGYENGYLNNVDITMAKEVIVDIELQESFTNLDEIVISGGRDKRKPLNDFATISARSFSVEETNRYAASIGDPARQALNFAGVTGNGNDLSNEIVIRGNSPCGFLWRLEGVEIPNPNHFDYLGNSVGSVSILSSNILTTSDFYTAAFPGEFGNATSGVFDLNFRKGNNEQNETRIAAGFLGLEIATEGPFSKKQGSSYIFNYRYSTLSILNTMGIKVAGDALPNYQDLSFNMNFPTKKMGIFNIYGLSGNSWFTYESTEDYGYGLIQETEEEKAKTAISGIRHLIFVSDRAFIKTSLNYSFKKADVTEQEKNDTYYYKYLENTELLTTRLSTLYNHKLNAKHTIQSGLIISHLNEKAKNHETDEGIETVYDDFNKSTNQFQAYVQWKWRLYKDITINSGLHSLYYGFTKNYSIEPRFALGWEYSKNKSLSLGMGLHSRAEDLYVYLIEKEDASGYKTQPNKDLELTKSAHFVLGHTWNMNKHTSLKVEAYFQHLYDLPSNSSEKFISINIRDIFEYQSVNNVTNDAVGRNYGVELTIERFLHKNFYYLFTMSMYESKFSFDKKTFYNTQYNGNYIVNALIGKDFKIRKEKENTIGINLKATYAGGQRYTATDEQLSILNEEITYSNIPFTENANEYFKIDAGINYKLNFKRTTHMLSLNVQNLTNRLNEFEPDFELSKTGDKVKKEVITQSGIIPILKYSIDL